MKASMSEEEGKAAEIASAMTGYGEDDVQVVEDVAAKIKKQKGAGSSLRSSGTSEPSDDGAGYNIHRASSPVKSSASLSIDPDGDSNTATIGEVWEVTRPPGLVRDGGTNHGYFYVPRPTSNDGVAFHAFLNEQKYTTRNAPCVDWKNWMQNHPSSTLIHFDDVPKEAMEKGRHLLAARPGSAFFSQTQLNIEELEEEWEDSGAYAQMLFLPPSRGRDADESYLSRDGLRQRGGGSRRDRGGQAGPPDGGAAAVPRVDPDEVPWLRKAFNQNIVAGVVAFTGPGLFNALQGLGNAGGSDPKVAATMNATLYATFSIFGILSGSLFNLLGTKILMSFGALTYGFYAISVYLWGQVDDSYAPMAIFASAVLGLGAACLWGAQGTMTLSYALENQKGLFFGVFWLIFNMGGVMGGFISFGINSGESGGSSVTPETYFTFCGLMGAGAIFAFLFVIKPNRVVKADGSAVEFEKTETAEGLGELREVAKLFTNRYMLLLTPLIIQSNWFYAYEFGGINGLLFDAPTRGLNSAIYWAISGVSSYVCGTYYLDRESYGGRRQRAIRGLAMISAINIGQWMYAIIYQFSTGYDKGNQPDPPINYSDGAAYAAPMILFMYCGLADSLVQTYAYWIIGAISNSPKTLSRYVGYYKGIQSFGACLAWIIEAEGASYRTQLMICATLACLFIPPTYMVAKCVEDKGSDEATARPDRKKDRYTENLRRMEDRMAYNVAEQQQNQEGTMS